MEKRSGGGVEVGGTWLEDTGKVQSSGNVLSMACAPLWTEKAKKKKAK